MLIMLVIDILVSPEILLVHYDAASIRPPNNIPTGMVIAYLFLSYVQCYFINPKMDPGLFWYS